ncbi:MAG: NAD-dependent epimerase/dehydratase family protein, partial [Candidatus Pacebacteria bacterium]|nr:NAD-dependent epimerase/dehydratase family protein [Candidatus Paceibacterota bacterium]
GDLLDGHSLETACRGRNLVIHTAKLSTADAERRTYYECNTKGTATVLHACIASKVPRLVYTSDATVTYNGCKPTLEADESIRLPVAHVHPYASSIALAEKMIRDAHGWEMVVTDPASRRKGHAIDTTVVRLSTCALRPHLLWGKDIDGTISRLRQHARRNRAVSIKGDVMSTITHVANAAAAHLQIAERLTPESAVGGAAYFIGDEAPVPFWRWFITSLKEAGIEATPKSLSFQSAVRRSRIQRWLRRIGVPQRPVICALDAYRTGISHTFCLNNAKKDFNYSTIMTPDAAVRERFMILDRTTAT